MPDLNAQLEAFKEQVTDFITTTEQARVSSELNRDYKDNKQWTDDELAKLKSRRQAAVTVNRIKPKVEGLKGLLVQRKTDPKAYPRTQKHEKAAECITDALRYVADNTNFDQTKLAVADNIFVEGYGAVVIGTEDRGRGHEITITQIPWDRYYYDIHSRRLDFSDKRWDGIILWMDADLVAEMFELSQEEAEALMVTQGDEDETFSDRTEWVDSKERRVRVCQHFFIEKGVWKLAYFTDTRFLVEPMDSPWLDEYGDPRNPIEAQTANIDRDNNRFGDVSYWLDLQREINHRRSKYLFLLSNRQTISRNGAVRDVPALKRELAKGDGHIVIDGGKDDFDILKTNDISDAQFALMQDAKHELDSVGFNAQLSGERQGDLSGKAISNLQSAAVNELAALYESITEWEQRVYRQVWERIRQFWNEEKWIRVTDDATKMRWVGFNTPITFQEMLEEQINDNSAPAIERKQSAALYQRMLADEDPRLQELHEIRNEVAEIDVDIIIDVSSDVVNIQREQFELLAKIAQTRPDVPFSSVIELSEIRSKDKILKQIKDSAEAAGQAAQERDDIEKGTALSKSNLDDAKATKATVEAVQTVVQTRLIQETPPDDTGVVI